MIREQSPRSESALFPGREGKGVRVAVIDSGVHAGHPHIGRVAGGVAISASGDYDETSYQDLLGHGTAVMAAIQEKAPAADYFAVKVFHSALRTSTRCLFAALEWAIAQRMDVVNLSLGVTNPVHADRFRRLVAAAAARGVILVSAGEAGGENCYPGCLPGVIGVRLDPIGDPDAFRIEELSYFASGYPRAAPGIPGTGTCRGSVLPWRI